MALSQVRFCLIKMTAYNFNRYGFEMDVRDYIFIVAAIAVFIYFGLSSKGAFSFERFSSKRDKFHHSNLVSVLLNLPDHSIDELLDLYKKEFGPGPARYARRTFRKWRSGSVQPASQTYERFLVHLPRVMSYDLKCEVLRHFMEEYAAKDEYQLDVFTHDWEEKLEPLVKQIIDKAFTTQLPLEVERKLVWLGDGDMQAAQNILRASQAEEGKIMVSMLREEFAGIEKMLAEEHLKPKVSHVLEFPYGSIRLNIKRRASQDG